MYNSLFLCSSINYRIKLNKHPSKEFWIFFMAENQQIFSVAMNANKLKKDNKTSTLLPYR